MSEVMAAPVVERQCRIEQVFDPNFIELLQLVPRNPQVRAWLLKLVGKLPPAECETFEQLKDWVELNCQPLAKRLPTPTNRRSRDDGISINVDFSETEYGRANYSVRRYGSEAFRISAEELMEMVQTAIDDGDGLDEVVEAVAGKIDDDAWSQCEPSMDDSGDHDYSEHEENETGDSESSFSRSDIRTAVLAFVRERHPELAAEL